MDEQTKPQPVNNAAEALKILVAGGMSEQEATLRLDVITGGDTPAFEGTPQQIADAALALYPTGGAPPFPV